MKKVLGYFLLSLPFLVMLVLMVADMGVKGAATVIGAIVGVTTCVAGGLILLED